MNDSPLNTISDFDYPSQQPGQTYSAEEQCRWQFGNKTQICNHKYKHGLVSLNYEYIFETKTKKHCCN